MIKIIYSFISLINKKTYSGTFHVAYKFATDPIFPFIVNGYIERSHEVSILDKDGKETVKNLEVIKEGQNITERILIELKRDWRIQHAEVH